MFGDLILALQYIINHDPQRTTVHEVSLEVENDSHYCVHSYFKSEISGPALQEAYHKAFPRVGNNWRVVAANLDATSLLMQQNTWPYCEDQQQCRCPNVAHHADLALSLGESANVLPQAYRGEKLFNVPLMILEVEGGKDVWGHMEQESKGMREVVSSLAVMGEAYLGFIYPTKISLWKATRNPGKTAIDIDKEDIHLNGKEKTLKEALEYFLERVIEIMVHQIYQNGPCVATAIAALRNAHGARAVHHTRNLNAGPCCPDCYIINTTRHASALHAGFPNINVNYE